jgi:hypothetical protein
MTDFQSYVKSWLSKTFCFDQEYLTTKMRAFRFLEEAIELCQAEGMSKEEMLSVLNYVDARPSGEKSQEVGGVMVTLAAYCAEARIDMKTEGWREFFRIDTETMRRKIREKQRWKPNGLPVPE